jgi:hypothetical protein
MSNRLKFDFSNFKLRFGLFKLKNDRRLRAILQQRCRSAGTGAIYLWACCYKDAVPLQQVFCNDHASNTSKYLETLRLIAGH